MLSQLNFKPSIKFSHPEIKISKFFLRPNFHLKLLVYTSNSFSSITLTWYCLLPSEHLSQSELILLLWFFRPSIWYTTSHCHSSIEKKHDVIGLICLKSSAVANKGKKQMEKNESQSKAVPRWGDLILIRKKRGQVMVLAVELSASVWYLVHR